MAEPPKDFNVFNDFNNNLNKVFFDLFRLQDKDRYAPAIIALKYSLLGITLRDHPINVGALTFDTRLSFIISIKSGNGKKEFVIVIKTIAKKLGYYVSEITALHEEQLIGKNKFVMKKDKDGKTHEEVEEIRGHFGDDILIKDDALLLLNSLKFEIARTYFITAWDKYGENLVRKRLTEQKREEALEYYPKFISIFFIQDKKIEKDNVDTGMTRKSPIIYIDAPEVDEDKYLARVKAAKPDYETFIKIVKNVKNAGAVDWKFTENAHKFIAKVSDKLYKEIAGKGAKAKEFALMLQWGIQDYIYVYSAILGATYQTNKSKAELFNEIIVDVPLCEISYNEFKIVLNAALEHWLHFVVNIKFTTLSKWEKIIIEELKNENAISEVTARYITPFINNLVEKYKISETTIYNAVASLEEKGLVERKLSGRGKQGEYNSKIWLKQEVKNEGRG